MSVYIFTVTHQDQTTATGSMLLGALPGNGRAVTFTVRCSCGYNHTLVGTQKTWNNMSGTGINSVAPPNDPGSQGFPKGKPPEGDPVPSWEGSPMNPEEDQAEGEGKGDGVDGADGGDEPADGGER